jgi:hypothetical protein
MDKPKAVAAAAHKLARMIYAMLTKGKDFTDQGQDYCVFPAGVRELRAASRVQAVLAGPEPLDLRGREERHSGGGHVVDSGSQAVALPEPGGGVGRGCDRVDDGGGAGLGLAIQVDGGRG